MSRERSVISLYAGAGGLDYGFEAAGFRTRVAVEMNAECCATMRANRRWPVIEGDIHGVTTKQILDAANLRPGEADVLIGGPPCQPFSKAGYWARGETSRLDDPRAATLNAYMRVVEEAKPKVFLLENVEGLSYAGKSEGVELLLEFVRQINKRTKSRYKPTFRVLNAADYGVPQLRYRFFMIAARDGAEFEFPAPTHASADGALPSLFEQLPRHRTAWNALGDLEVEDVDDLRMRGKWAALLPSIPEGENYLWHTDRGGGLPLFGWRRRFWSFLLKLAKDKPSWTIQAQPGPAIGPFHWTSRMLSMRELCRLQTFPDDVVITGGRIAVQRQLGNAVPSLLAEVLARAIRAQLLGGRPSKGSPRLLPPNNTPTPPPEAVAEVPRAFLDLVGEHEAHPGTGKGYAAAVRTESAARDEARA